MSMFDAPKTDTPRLLLTPRETARALGVSERTLATYTSQGLFPVVRIGRSVRYDLDVLREWIRDHSERKPATSPDSALTDCQDTI